MPIFWENARSLTVPRRRCHKNPMTSDKKNAVNENDPKRERQRAIVSKRKIYYAPKWQEGQPVEEALSGVTLPESLKGAKLYQTEDGPVIALPPRRK